MVSAKQTLSKSTFVRGCKCLKSLYLYKFQYHLRDEVSQQQRLLFDQGHDVGILARRLFPEGEDASVNPAYNYAASVEKTRQIIQSGQRVIYEAAFMVHNVYAAIDILVIRRDGWYLYEVKSSTAVKEYHTIDAALQYYILKHLGLPVKKVCVVCINNQYERQGAVEPTQLFTIHDVTSDALELQPYVCDHLDSMQQMLKSGKQPSCKIGPHCNDFYGCDFQGHCWKKFDEVEYPVTSVSKIGDKLWEMVSKDVYCQTQIPDEMFFRLSPLQRQQISCTLDRKSPPPDIDEIKAYLSTITGPVAFLDFESISTAIPLFNQCRPYQQIPFQFSLHCDDGQGHYYHHEYLGDGNCDPRPDLIKHLLASIPAEGSILVYYMPFERSRLEELGRNFPKYRRQLEKVIDRLVDLIIPFRNRWVYHFEMNGSASIKSVLPALFPELDYSKLNISDGAMASMTYLSLMGMTDDHQIASARKYLLEYCKMDTYAMVELFKYLKGLVTAGAKVIPISVVNEFEPDLS